VTPAHEALLNLPLGKGGFTVIDAADAGLVEGHSFYLDSTGYAACHTKTETSVRLHTLIAGRHPGRHVDHINGNKLDNRRANLRVVSPSTNQVNRHRLSKRNTSGIRGVAFRPNVNKTNPWHVQIGVNGTTKYIGMYSTQELAVAARRTAELEYYGEVCP
jgi:hypothetical protein